MNEYMNVLFICICTTYTYSTVYGMNVLQSMEISHHSFTKMGPGNGYIIACAVLPLSICGTIMYENKKNVMLFKNAVTGVIHSKNSSA